MSSGRLESRGDLTTRFLPLMTSSCWAATIVLLPTALTIPAAFVVLFGDWVYVELPGRIALAAFFAAGAVLAGAIAGVALTGCLIGLDRARGVVGRIGLAVALASATGLWLPKMLRMVSVSFQSSVYADPLSAAAIGVGLLVIARLARGARPWQRADVFALSVVGSALVLTVFWLYLAVLRRADVLLGRQLNIAVVAGAHALVWGSLRAGALPWVRSFGLPLDPRRSAGAFASLLLASTVAIVPLHGAAMRAGEPPSLAPTSARDGSQDAEVGAPLRGAARNVILISVDTLRADHLGIYGYPKATSPNIDRFFSDGLVFERAFSQAPWTLPAHASMFTGQYPSTHGSATFPSDTFGYVDRLSPDLTTIAEMLREQGFETAAFTGGVFLTRAYGLDQGFETFRATRTTRMREAVNRALAWLDGDRSEPFFLFLHAFDVHRYEPPRYFEDLPASGYDGPLRKLHADQPRLLERAVAADGLSAPTEEDMRFVQHLYDTEIRVADEELGRLFVEIESRGLNETTAVILTSDHGESFWEHGDSGHMFTLYNPTLRVPLLISAPGDAGQRRMPELARVIDIPATILDLTNTATPLRDEMHGASVLPMDDGRVSPRVAIAEADRFGTQAAIFSGEFKYIHYGMPSYNPLRARFALLTIRGMLSRFNRGEELFDLEEDPEELHDLAAAHPERVAALRKLLFATVASLQAAPEQAGEGPEIEFYPELEDQLRALGYVD